MVLAHGLLGFSELRVSRYLPAVQYWRGIREALEARGCRVVCTTVPATGSIAERAERLRDEIDQAVRGGRSERSGQSKQQAQDASEHSEDQRGEQSKHPSEQQRDTSERNEDQRSERSEGTRTKDLPRINIIAHSMGGLDARYMAAHVPPRHATVQSVVTVSTPHRGSAIAEAVLERTPSWALTPSTLLGSGRALEQLTRRYVQGTFNPGVPNRPGVAYLSYGAEMTPPPSGGGTSSSWSPIWDIGSAGSLAYGGLQMPLRVTWRALDEAEGPNDGLVSVESARWGEYAGTLVGVSHLDLINWTNRARWAVGERLGVLPPRTFNAVAFYLGVADMLARRGF